MTNLKKVMENLKGIKEVDIREVADEVVAAFEDFKFKGMTDVIISSYDIMNGFSPSSGLHSAYIDHADAPIIKFELEEVGNEVFSIVNVW